MTAAVSKTAASLYKGTFWTGAKKVVDFLMGTWTTPIGLEYRNMRQNPALYGLADKKAASIFKACKLYRTNSLLCEEAQKHAGGYGKEVAKEAGKKVAKSFLGKIFGGFFKYAMPALFIVPPIIKAIKELGNGGGILGALKELAKGAISLLGFAAGGLLVTAVCGVGGWAIIPMLIVPALVAAGVDWTTGKILGKSTEEKIAEAKQNQQNTQQITNTQNMYANNNLYQQRNMNLGYDNLYQQRLRGYAYNNFGQNYPPPDFNTVMEKSQRICNMVDMLCSGSNGRQMSYLS